MNQIFAVVKKELYCAFKDAGTRREFLFAFAFLLILPNVAYFLMPLRPDFSGQVMQQYAQAVRGALCISAGLLASILAASTFAGEKEHKTLEKLLSVPIRDFNLFTGKVLSIFIPVFALGVLNFFVTSIAIALTNTYWGFNVAVFPLYWLIMGFILIPAIALYGASATILLSLRLDNEKKVEHTTIIAVFPLAIFTVLPIFLPELLSPQSYIFIAPIVWTIAIALLLVGGLQFRRHHLLEKL